MTTLQNKTALVTGALRGIGCATAVALAEAGAHVLVHYGRSAQEAELWLPTSVQEGDVRRRSARTWELQTAEYRWLRRFARSWASGWMCSYATPE